MLENYFKNDTNFEATFWRSKLDALFRKQSDILIAGSSVPNL